MKDYAIYSKLENCSSSDILYYFEVAYLVGYYMFPLHTWTRLC